MNLTRMAEAFADEITKIAAGPGPLATAKKWGKRALVGGGALAVGSYALGRGLQAGIGERQKKEKAEANRAARLAGNPTPYA